MVGGYYSVFKTVNRSVDCGGPLQYVQRDCSDYVELAILGVNVSFIKSGVSVLHQKPSKVDNEGRIEELSMTWMTPRLGTVSLPPVIFKLPKHTTNIMLVWDQVKKEATQRFRDSIKEACAKYRMPCYSYDDEVGNFEAQLVNHMLSMNLGV